MPVNIKVGGKQYIPSDIEARRVPVSHVSFQSYDEMCRMASARDRAVYLWTEAEALKSEIRDRDHSHPKYGEAVIYLSDLQGAITNECVIYLASERRADLCWQELLPDQREELHMDETFQVLPDRPNLYGLWHSQLPLSEPAPPEFPMDEIALLIAVTPQLQVYQRMRYERAKERE